MCAYGAATRPLGADHRAIRPAVIETVVKTDIIETVMRAEAGKS
jgi:hypothetical protein